MYTFLHPRDTSVQALPVSGQQFAEEILGPTALANFLVNPLSKNKLQ